MQFETEEGRKAAFTLHKHVLSTTDSSSTSGSDAGGGGGGGISVLPSKYPAVLETRPHVPSSSTSHADAFHQDTSIYHHQPLQQQEQQPQSEEKGEAKTEPVYNKYLSSSTSAAPDLREEGQLPTGKTDKKARINIDK